MKTKQDHTSKPTLITQCVCEHKYQDSVYGKGNRVHNPCRTTTPQKTGYRCTVCGRTHDA